MHSRHSPKEAAIKLKENRLELSSNRTNVNSVDFVAVFTDSGVYTNTDDETTKKWKI